MPNARSGKSRGKAAKSSKEPIIINGVFKSKLLNVQKTILNSKLKLIIIRTPIVSELAKKEIVLLLNNEHAKKCLICKTNSCKTKQSHEYNIFHIADVNLAIGLLDLLPEQIQDIADNKVRAIKERNRERRERKKAAQESLLQFELAKENTRVTNLSYMERAEEWINNVIIIIIIIF